MVEHLFIVVCISISNWHLDFVSCSVEIGNVYAADDFNDWYENNSENIIVFLIINNPVLVLYLFGYPEWEREIERKKNTT